MPGPCRGLAAVLWVVGAVPATAEVVGIEIQSRGPFADGRSFGRSGPYEKIVGRLRLEVDPADEANARVADLSRAPRNARGKVEFWTDFFLLAPADPTRGNRRLFYDVNNRGNKLALGAFNDAGGNDPVPGNGFLMREGYAVLWCGWNGDVAPGGGRMMIGLPIATENGRPIEGKIYAEITVNAPAKSQPLVWGNTDPYPAIGTDATLTMRPTRRESAVEVPRDRWAFARWEDGRAVPDPKHLHLKDGFKPGWLYELVYVGRDPRVTGLGFAAVRDAASFFKYGRRDNPLAGAVERAIIFGISQSGRFIYHFLYDGFNTDEAGRMVFDGAMPHVGGGGRGQFNYRFAQTTRHGSPHEDHLYPSDAFPFNTVPQRDPATGREGDSFGRVRARGHLPKIFFTETSAEYWCRAASLLHTDVEGVADAPLDPNVRLYFFTGNQHGAAGSADRGIYKNAGNTLDYRPLLRALLTAMDRWIGAGEEPPPSDYPRIADGTLVSVEAWRAAFPKITGAAMPEECFAPLRLDPGPRWDAEGIADHVPPRIVGAPFRTRVPQVDADGIERAGIKLPDVSVPLATFTGWNVRGPEAGAEGQLGRWSGSGFAFALTAEERAASGDPRPSILERYPTAEAYVARVAAAAADLRARRLLLDEDVVRIIETARSRKLWDR